MLSSIDPLREVDDQEVDGTQAFYRFCYERLDAYSRGHAAEIMRLASFLIVGGLGTLVNLACVWVFSRYTTLPYDGYIVLATEIALLCNFLLNDRFTFHGLVDNQRPFWLRCVRFHGPSALGFVLTLAISYVAHHALRLSPVMAQAVAILIVTFVNFSMHRLWTYRASAQAAL
ncbi:MAG TPA: GtrA family protein [Ktedonobacterales bacterium]|jgi:dolichol-phosphate mannosyltransferase